MIAEIDDIPDITFLYLDLLGIKGQEYYETKDVLRDFLNKHINIDVFVSCIYIDDSIVSTAMMIKQTAFLDKDCFDKCGHYGIIKNVYTELKYRNSHFATGCINELVRLAYDNKFIKIYARYDIKNICERIGFESDSTLNLMSKKV